MTDCGDNGGDKSCNLFGKETVKYPVKFDLKAIVDASIAPEETQKNLEKVLNQQKVPFSDWRTKSSSGGKYTSYTVSVDIENKEMLDTVYAEIKKVPGLKFAM